VRPASICRIEAANASASARLAKSAISLLVSPGEPVVVTWKPSGPVGVTAYGIRHYGMARRDLHFTYGKSRPTRERQAEQIWMVSPR
jgi:hypothetical protein